MAVSLTQQTGITLDKQVHFRSTGRAGTGAGETIPHGLGVIPTIVLVQPRDSSKSVVITSYDKTNIVLTVENAAVYDILALF